MQTGVNNGLYSLAKLILKQFICCYTNFDDLILNRNSFINRSCLNVQIYVKQILLKQKYLISCKFSQTKNRIYADYLNLNNIKSSLRK